MSDQCLGVTPVIQRRVVSDDAPDLADQLFPRACQIAEFLDRRRGHEAAADQAVGQQIRDPGRVVGVALATRDVANVHRVGQDEGEVLLEHVPDRLPVDARGFHRHVRTPRGGQPVRQLEQPLRRRRDRAMVIRDVRARREAHARRDTAGVDIHPGTLRIEDFHQAPPCGTTLAWSPQKRSLKDALTGRTGVAIRGARGTPGPTRERALSTIEESTSVPASAPTVACFLTSWVPRSGVGN